MIDQEKGFGFIDSPELANVFNKDVFVHSRQLNGIPIDTQVNFAVMLSNENKPQAVDIYRETAKAVGNPKNTPITIQMGNGKAEVQKGAGRPGPYDAPPSVNIGKGGKGPMETHIGWVKTYSEKTGWGFISSDSVQGDVYFKGNFPGVTKNSYITFELQWLPDGKPRAHNIKLQESPHGGGGGGGSGGDGGGYDNIYTAETILPPPPADIFDQQVGEMQW